jgi:hypothetical protein
MRFCGGESRIALETNPTLTVEYGAGPSIADGTTGISVGRAKWTVPFGARLVLTVQGALTVAVVQGSRPRASYRVESNSRVIITTGHHEATIRCRVILRNPDGTVTVKNKRIVVPLGWTGQLTGLVEVAVWDCSCGCVKCREQHRLDAWQPCYEYNLLSFVANATHGPLTPARTMSTRTLIQGMYLARLAFGSPDLKLPALVMVPVEFSVCTLLSAKHSNPNSKLNWYEGNTCLCGHVFDRTVDKRTTRNVLILVHHHPPVYEAVKRCKCPECGNVFEITMEDIYRHCMSSNCGHQLWDYAALRKIAKETDSWLKQAWAVERARQQLGCCPHLNCGAVLSVIPWCPRCATSTGASAGPCLPQREVIVWRRTFIPMDGPISFLPDTDADPNTDEDPDFEQDSDSDADNDPDDEQ